MAKTDIRKIFKAYDIRGEYGKELTEPIARAIGYCTARWLHARIPPARRQDRDFARIVVGRDMRPSGTTLAPALIEGLRATGADVLDIGMVDTPMTTFAVRHLDCCGAVMVTASHNPPNMNGFKISGAGAAAVGEDSGLFEIRDAVLDDPPVPAGRAGSLTELDLTEPYRRHVLRFATDVRPLTVAIDASNGMAGKMVPAIFGDLPLTIHELNFTHDGRHFAHDPNPMKPANTAQLEALVRRKGADFGACFDGDADRCVLIDENGGRIPCDMVTALLAGEMLRDQPEGTAVVYDLRSSWAVPEVIREAGGTPVRERVGHAFMKVAMKENNAIVGGELSGHYYFRDNGYADSGMILFAVVLSILSRRGRPLGELIAPLSRYHATGERNFVPVGKDKQAVLAEVAAAYSSGEVDSLDGVTVTFPDWWFNLRPSNTENKLRLNLEARRPDLRDEKYNELSPMLGELDEG